MLTSYNLLLRSRFRRSHQHWFCTIVALKPEPQPPPTTVVAATTTTSYSLPSRRLLFHGFDSRRHLHHSHHHSFHRSFFTRAKPAKIIEFNDRHSQGAVKTALWCNFLVFSLKFGVWLASSSHVMLAEVVHSVADFANQLTPFHSIPHCLSCFGSPIWGYEMERVFFFIPS
ncbi:metal tolerance protein C4-like [Trifolium medium]|uniref:Metal tolerance protein C4-like n=1 Tax=Trifolium medium TaxID=97028 RepID=A0A392LZR6_9FABA|nr:metal tolerance protein C4-like [Trifolium medium]